MKYIFLDIDGVLNNEKYTKKCYNKNGKKPFWCENVPFNPRCLKRLAKIVRKTKAKIILTSTWRLYDKNMTVLKARIAEYGLEITDKTENINHLRGFEIKEWLKNNNFNWNTDDFIVIDDEVDDITNYINELNVIKINSYYGITWNNMIDAIIKLGN